MSTEAEAPVRLTADPKTAEIVAAGVAIAKPQHALDLMMEASYMGAERLRIRVDQLDPSFFDLRSGLAGEVFQKGVNYHMKLEIAGDIADHLARSEALRALVRECNRGRDVAFVE